MEQELAGLLNIRKPSGITSFGIVRQVKRVIGARKVGHCGTLDPLAEGVLLILYGSATRLQSSMMSLRKVYRTRMRLGIMTDTGDAAGKILRKQETGIIPREAIDEALAHFTGEIQQIPPMYSALKYKGQRLYTLAREGKEVERLPRAVTIYRIEFLGREEDLIELRVECSRGTYIRTLVEDIGTRLGSCAMVDHLCREQVGSFSLVNAIDGVALRTLQRDELLANRFSLEKLASLGLTND
jgi:tRNA pseudouridine55 synthase